MKSARIALILTPAILLFSFATDKSRSEDPGGGRTLEGLERTMKEGNFSDAYQGFHRLAVDPRTDSRQLSQALTDGIACLQRLNRTAEIDPFREEVIRLHAGNARLLWRAAQTYVTVDHHGFLVSGKFHRGPHRGGGKPVNAAARDRVRALQLMQQAMPAVDEQFPPREASDFYLALADMVLNGPGNRAAWRLQARTDLSRLPDYEPGWYAVRGQTLGAPVGRDGRPILYTVPSGWKAAESDGQRWRFALARAVQHDPRRRNVVRLRRAGFLHGQFGVQTLADYGPLLDRAAESRPDGQKTGTFALATLSDEETIAKLAVGVRRFALPDASNPIKLYQQIVADDTTDIGARASEALARIFENRRQYSRAADAWRQNIQRYGDSSAKQRRLDQIDGAWGRFETVMTQPAGEGATVDFRFRNGRRVTLTAHRIHLAKLLDDLKAYLKRGPHKLDWNQMQLENLGHRLVTRNEQKYLGAEVARWQLDLHPRANHGDRRITITTPLQKAGAYLLTATMAGGNTSKIILWVSDMAIVKKPMAGKTFYYVSDAISGQPIDGATLELFGYRRQSRGKNRFQIETRQHAEHTDKQGQVQWKFEGNDSDYQWLTTATTTGGRLAFLGFAGLWRGNYAVPTYDQTKVFCITDRPVYRPDQPVHFKLWVRHARYDGPPTSEFAHQAFQVVILDPRGSKIDTRQLVADQYGGIEGEYHLPTDAALGVYRVVIERRGGGSFRVEEYKKPEFEVTVDAPDKPVLLGEKVTATVRARYYFGSPVTQARVKVKVLRRAYDTTWYPPAPWDWLYGPGYWWFAGNDNWYPSWQQWGYPRPSPVWWWRPRTPPEVVAELETEIGPDGTVRVDIDTSLAKALHGDQDHRYQIIAEVVDRSRRTIVGTGEILVGRKPVHVVAWTDRGYYRVGDVIHASVAARTLDQKPLAGKGKAELFRVSYDQDRRPVETSVGSWDVETDRRGLGKLRIQASRKGQYRLAYQWTDAAGHTFDAGYLLTIVGDRFDGAQFQFSDLELVPDRREYAPGETVRLLVNTNRVGTTVLLFVRPAGGIYLPPRVVSLKGKSTLVDIGVEPRDMPNFFVEAVTVARGRVFTVTREICVPPRRRVLGVEVVPSSTIYRPGERANIQLKLTDETGAPFVGSTVVSIYDKAVESIAGGSNVPGIKEFFWKWRRRHHAITTTNLGRYAGNLTPPGQTGMANIGLFGAGVADALGWRHAGGRGGRFRFYIGFDRGGTGAIVEKSMAPRSAPLRAAAVPEAGVAAAQAADTEQALSEGELVEPTVRREFADTACWQGGLTTDKNGMARVSLAMPENLTTWRIRVWAMGEGTRVGEASAEVVTRKDLIVRLQAPRFFVQRDEVVLSANVHNYLGAAKHVRVALQLGGASLQPIDGTPRTIHVDKDGEARVDWRVRAVAEGTAVVRVMAQTDTESDAVEMSFPVFVHGMVKTDARSGVLRPDEDRGTIQIRVPTARRAEASRLEVRFSPTLAGAMVDALPYLVDYPYGCTEQTLNRFLPTVITQKVLLEMGVDLPAIRAKRTNLNAQELGDGAERARQWKRWGRNPVFDAAEVRKMVRRGVESLTEMQLADGGWGWFSGWGEHAFPHTTAVVVHGLQIAKRNDVALVPGVLERGVAWLDAYQQRQLKQLANAAAKRRPYKLRADNADALVYMVLVDAGVASQPMRDHLYRDRSHLSVYAQAMLGLALHKQGDQEKLAVVLRNISQFLVEDAENQTAYLNLPGSSWWWYGSEMEAHAYYLKLLVATDPKGETAAKIVKYLVNNRRHATYWNSTRDTAVVIEAMADYLRATGESKPQMVVEVWMDGKRRKAVEITADNLFTFDNRWVLEGDAVEAGDHTIEIRRHGRGTVYYNAYLTNFTLEDPIDAAGLELRIDRKFYRLDPIDTKVDVAGSRGQVADQRVEKYRRIELPNLSTVRSGDLVEVELTVDSKNDYEYIVIEDRKAAGFEAVDLRSGYNGNALGAYVAYHDNRVVLFVRRLARGRHSVAYRLRAEVPGRFSALPARAAAMYAPELVGNSGEIKWIVDDRREASSGR